MELTDTQNAAFEAFRNGKSFLLTGAAGTGKSRLISEFRSYSESKSKNVAICATTGLAALQIQGRTIDSFMRIFPQDVDVDMDLLVQSKLKSKAWVQSLRNLDSILIDEASMLTPRKFQQCDALLRATRNNQSPFGDVQLVLIGDFFQLPPVISGKSKLKETFLFELDLFYNVMDTVFHLEQVHRQTHREFIDLLGRMRLGKLTEQDHEVLRSRVHAELKNDGIKPTCLFSQNTDVDKVNIVELQKLPKSDTPKIFSIRNGCKKSSNAKSSSSSTDLVTSLQKLQESLIKEINLPQSIELRIGAQVMLVYNIDVEGGLVNGSRGVVIGFAKTSKENPNLEYDFEPLGSVKKEGSDKFYYPDEPLPIVKFGVSNSNGKSRALSIPYVRWDKTEKKVGEAWVTALPLKLAWATTIHKSQGATLDRVEASIDRTVFAYGQAYVALSRVTSLDGLTLKSYDPSVVRADPRVVNFFESDFDELKRERMPSSSILSATSVPGKRTYDSSFSVSIMTSEQIMASEARMLEMFANQANQDEED